VVWDVDRGKAAATFATRGKVTGRTELSGGGTRILAIVDGTCTVFDIPNASQAPLGACDAASFDAAGLATWITGREVWREGGDRPIVRLPRAERAVGFFGPRPTTGTPQLVGTCARQRDRLACDRLWLTDLATRKTVLVETGGPIGMPLIAPTQDRACFVAEAGLRCAGLDGTVATIDRSPSASFGHVAWPAPAFAPSGNAIAYLVGEGKTRTIRVHDLAAGTTADVVTGAYQDAALADDTTVLAYEYWGKHPGPALAWFDAGSRAQTVIVRDATEYTAPVLLPGRRDRLFAGREQGAGRELVEVRSGR